MYALLGDKDGRVRASAATGLCHYIQASATTSANGSPTPTSDQFSRTSNVTLLIKFISERIYKELPKPLCDLRVSINNSLELDKVLAKVLYRLAIKLLELDDKNQQVIINCSLFI